MIKLNFNSNGTTYTATEHDIFMDNGAKVVYIKGGKFADPAERRVELKPTEWQRIKQNLKPVDYEKYYGRKPLMSGVAIYQLKQQ